MDESSQAIAALLPRVRARDAASAEALVEVLYPVVIAVVERRRPRSMDAADIAQEVFLKFFQHFDGFRGGEMALVAWVRRIAFTTCLNHHRARKARPELRWADLPAAQQLALEASQADGTTPSPAEQAAGRDLLEALLSQLPPRERSLVELVDVEQRSWQEVKALTGWSAVNIRVRLFRARRKLRAVFGELMKDHESP
jgi:RNA polymerase sigma-70 factor (ECF subfamily)